MQSDRDGEQRRSPTPIRDLLAGRIEEEIDKLDGEVEKRAKKIARTIRASIAPEMVELAMALRDNTVAVKRLAIALEKQ